MPGPLPDPAITPELRTWLAGAGLTVRGSYRVGEVAELLQVTPRTVYDMIARGAIGVLATTSTADGVLANRASRRHRVTGGQRGPAPGSSTLSPMRIPLSSLADLLCR